jgi:hypothetical protein
VEQTMTEMWRELLGLREVGLDEDFFSLGGTSLIGAKLIARVNQEFGTQLPLKVIYEARTVAGLALAVARVRDRSPGSVRTHRQRLDLDEAVKLLG